MDYVDFAAELMKKMVSVPSESQNEEELAVYLCEYLANIGMEAKLQRTERGPLILYRSEKLLASTSVWDAAI